jgi:putative ABC transport system ATP-binding protein
MSRLIDPAPLRRDPPSTPAAVAIRDLRFRWHADAAPTLALTQLRIENGERVFIEGPSGSGKSTLLGLLAGVMIPEQGQLRVLGTRLDRLGGIARDQFRAHHIGYLFQRFNLIPYLSILENVLLPCHFSVIRRQRALRQANGLEAEARRLLEYLGMAQEAALDRPVRELSVGQQQRVAAARALMGAPELLIADEPTSSLDGHLRQAFLRLLFEEVARSTATLIFVSHDISLAPIFDRTIHLAEINTTGAGP